MRLLNEELKIVEQKIYNENDTCILSLDTKINLLQKENLLLNNKIGLLNISKEKSKNLNLKLIKKDKYIHKLKKSIKNDYLNFNEEMLPKSYMRISKRFPHLTLQEIIDFEKKVRENGGSIQVHRGKFRLTERLCVSNSYQCSQPKKKIISWDCCHTVGANDGRYQPVITYPVDYKYSNRISVITRCAIHTINPSNYSGFECCGAIDLKNSKPDGKCDFPVFFYLNEEDEKLQDVKEVKVSNVSLSISNNIKILEKTIEEYSNKILKLKKLQETLDLLVDT